MHAFNALAEGCIVCGAGVSWQPSYTYAYALIDIHMAQACGGSHRYLLTHLLTYLLRRVVAAIVSFVGMIEV